MSGRVAERRAESARFDRLACERVGVTAHHAGANTFTRPALRVPHERVQCALRLIRALAHHDSAGDIGAIPVDDGAKVLQMPLASSYSAHARVLNGTVADGPA